MTTGRTCSARAAALVLMLALLPSAAAAQRGKAGPVERGQTLASMGVHGFSVVLVVGATQAGSATDTVPEAARKALADMKDFLPYKRYQLLDAAWILCCGSAHNGVSGRVLGPDGRNYRYVVDPVGIADSKLTVHFTMQEVPDVATPAVNLERLSDTARLEHSRQVYEAIRERDEADLQLRTIKQRHDVGTATPSELESASIRARRAQQRSEDLQALASGQGRTSGQGGGGGGRGGSSTRSMMDSTFSIALGETVVIGTSRLNGDRALIALLTAAAKPGGAR